MLTWLGMSAFGTWVRESQWGWAIALTFHALGTATVLGMIFTVGLRLLGLFRTIPFTLLPTFIKFIWVAVIVQILSGFSLFSTKPAEYATDVMFLSKFSFVILSIIATRYLQNAVKRGAAAWDGAGAASQQGVQLAVGTCVLWTCVLVAGRLTAYLGLYGG